MHQLYVNQRGVVGHWDAVYARYLQEILDHGETFVGRNGETKAIFGCSVTVDTRVGFPLTRLRKMPIKNLFREFLFSWRANPVDQVRIRDHLVRYIVDWHERHFCTH